MNNDIGALRGHLFGMLEQLTDKTNKDVDLDRARVAVAVADSIIDSAKVEVAFLQAVGGVGSGFIPHRVKALPNGSKDNAA